MPSKILTIVSGAPSGALNIAMTLANYLGDFYESKVAFRKYNKTETKDISVVKDFFIVDYIWSLCKKINNEKPDMIIVHGYSTHLWTKIAAAIKKIPLIHVEHNVENYTMFRRWLLKCLDPYTLAYICVSQGVAKHLIKQGVDANKVTVIYNGIDVAAFHKGKQPQPHFTIGMTARFSKQKDQLTLIKAVEHLVHKENLPIRLILQGNGKQKEKCATYVKDKQLTEIITFETGRLSELTPRLDLFVLATHYEGFGLVVCEAMAGHIPVIASDVPGVDEIIEHERDGYLVPAGDYQALAEQIRQCYWNKQNDGEEVKAIVDAAYRKTVTMFSIEMMCKNYYQRIQEYYTYMEN